MSMRKRLIKAEGRVVTIDPSLIQAASRGENVYPTGDIEGTWMGPGSPPNVMANPAPDSRGYDYPVNYNTRFQPKSGEGVTFGTLRLFADAYDLLRVVIERRKDQVESFEWEILPKSKALGGKKVPKEGPTQDQEAAIQTVTEFFEHPSAEYSWAEWCRVLLEDLLVLDAVAIAPRFTYGNTLYSLDLIDPATIKRVIDGRGMTPMPPDPAYQQIIKGVPAVDFTVEEMYYWMRNPRSWKAYGFSPVEWIMVTVNIALSRQAFTLNYFTEGNIPEALATVPQNWTMAQIKEFQTYWDDLMAGHMANRRRMRWVPFDASKIKELKQPDHKNEFEEWLARLICFAFSISPSSLIKELNRSTAETNKEIATSEGLMPLLNMLRTKLNYIIQKVMGFKDLQFVWKLGDSIDALQQAQINQIYLQEEVLTPDEVREDIGKKPLTPDEREKAFPTPPPPVIASGAVGEPGKPGEKPPAGKEPKAKEEPPAAKRAKLKAVAKELANRVTLMEY